MNHAVRSFHLSRLLEIQTPLVLVTVTEATGSAPRGPGAKMIVHATGVIEGSIGGGNLERLVIEGALECLSSRASKKMRIPLGAQAGQCCGGTVEVFMEPLNLEPRLYLFGAGHVGQALSRVLEGTPFQVTILDERAEWIEHPDLAKTGTRLATPWTRVRELTVDASTYFVVMTHSHADDEQIIAHALKTNASYIGLIGSESKWARFRQRLSTHGFSDQDLARVKCPIGLNTGGKAPQEVAISVAAELLQNYYDRS